MPNKLPMRRFAWLPLIGLVLAACGGGSFEPRPERPLLSPSTTVHPAEVPSEEPSVGLIPSCDEVPRVSAPEDAYRDSPIYVANEMPVEEVQAWASRQPGYEAIWIDREHNGWITVAFSVDAEARQADLEREFPGVGVVAVAVDWSVAELNALQSRLTSELGSFLDTYAVWTSETQGVVGIGVSALTEEVKSEVERRFAGEPVCLEGPDPSTLPAPGPQPLAGDGWRLLVDEPQVGRPYRTGIATDPVSLEALWATIGLEKPLPEVDFQTEVVIWFGAVFGGSCPGIRLDDVIVEGSTVYALIVLPDPPVACTLDANPHAYVVAVQRSKLPVGPFAIQLDADGPPGGAPEERTLVNADLSRPGAVATPDQIGPDPNLPEPYMGESGDFLEPGFAVSPYHLNIHCGIEWLGEFNGFNWRTTDSMPAEWEAQITEEETIELSLLLVTEPEPMIEATAAGVTVIYRPTNEPLPGCD